MTAPNSNAQPKSASLEGLPADMHHLLFSEYINTSSASIFSLGQSSRALRQAALPYVYRDLVLGTGSALEDREEKQSVDKYRWCDGPTPAPDPKRPGYESLIDILCDDKDFQIARHVRSITVKDEIQETMLTFIMDKVSECGQLRKLNWETPTHIPSSILDKIHTTWPELELSIRVLDRWEAPQGHRQMDLKLLSSPLLVNLVYTLYSQAYSAGQPCRSEWPRLTQALVAGGSIRALHILCTDDRPSRSAKTRDRILGDDEPLKLARLDLDPETRLPRLEELSIIEERENGRFKYLWDAEHCRMLRDTLDCSRLHKLNFGDQSPGVFLTTFKGLLPNLKALKFGVVEASVDCAKAFLESANYLESLVISYTRANVPALWPAIRKHKNTLKEFILRPSSGDSFIPPHYSSSLLQEVKNDFSSLERLGWEVPCHQNIDAEYLNTLSTMSLKKLDFFFNLPGHANDYGAEVHRSSDGSTFPPQLSVDSTKKAAIPIMELISQTQEHPLEWLTLHISYTGSYDRGQWYVRQTNMQLRQRKDGRSEGDQQYEFRGSTLWHDMIPIKLQVELEEE